MKGCDTSSGPRLVVGYAGWEGALLVAACGRPFVGYAYPMDTSLVVVIVGGIVFLWMLISLLRTLGKRRRERLNPSAVAGHPGQTAQQVAARTAQRAAQQAHDRPGIGTGQPAQVVAGRTLLPEHAAPVDQLIQAGRPIEAIRLTRQFTGWRLKDAKDYVEGRANGRF